MSKGPQFTQICWNFHGFDRDGTKIDTFFLHGPTFFCFQKYPF